MLNFGDILFQLVSLLSLIFFFVMIVMLVRSFQQRKNQLDKIEEKMNTLLEQVKKINKEV